MASKLEHALTLAEQGFYVFPCDPQTNTPTVPWREASTRNKKTITDWFICPILGFEQDLNIGVDCYKSGVTVIDVDVKDGKKGKESYEQLETSFGWGKTRVQRTPSGGLHRIYRAQGFRNSVEALAPGIDVRGDGGYYIAAGSTRRDKTYTLFEDIEPKPLPEWLEQKLTSIGKAVPLIARDSGKTIVSDNEGDIQAAIEFLQNHEPAVEGHGGDNHTFITFCQLKEKGITIATAIDLVEEHWNPLCSPPWDHEDIIQKANSAYRSAQNATGSKSPFAEFDIPPALPPQQEPPKHTFSGAWKPKKPSDIPHREWVIPGIAQKKKLSLWVSEPGVGKSTLTLGTALAKACGRHIMGFDTGDRGAVAIFNNEDDIEEMERRLVACMQHYDVTEDELKNPDKDESFIFLNSGELKRLKIAKRLNDGSITPDALQPLIVYVKEHNIQLLVIDPFAETHPANENNNEEIGKVAAMYRYIAQQGNCAVLLIHHSRKPDKAASDGHAGDPNSARGASSLLGVARSVWTLNNLGVKDAEKFDIAEEDKSNYIIFQQAKANMSAPGGNTKFFKRIGEKLYLSPEDKEGESVGILEPTKLIAKTPPTKQAEIGLLHALEEVLERGRLTYAEAATAIIGLAEYTGVQPDAMLKRLKKLTYTETVTGFKGTVLVEERKDSGRKVKYLILKPFPPKSASIDPLDII